MEKWKVITEASNYEVSNLGRVRNATTGYVLKPRMANSGYGQVSIKLDATGRFINRYLHRLTAIEWVGNPESKPEVNHTDGDKTNNSADNLEWVTPSENQVHRHSIGIRKTSNRRVGKFDKAGNLLAEFDSIVDAAKSIGSPRVSIDNVLQGKRKTLFGHVWKYLD